MSKRMAYSFAGGTVRGACDAKAAVDEAAKAALNAQDENSRKWRRVISDMAVS
jgi:hypothetical protein